MNLKFQHTGRMISAAMLISLLSFGALTSKASENATKDKKGGKTTLFEDGWQSLKPLEGENQTGNFTAISLIGEPVQAANKKWTCAWGNWSVNGTDGEVKRGLVMVPDKQENDDWLVSTQIDLDACKKAVLNIEGYSKYGTDAGNDFKILISVDYKGDVEAANWDEMWLESFHKQNQAQVREISLKKYRGQKVVVAFRSIHKGKSLKNLTRTTFLSKVSVIAVKK